MLRLVLHVFADLCVCGHIVGLRTASSREISFGHLEVAVRVWEGFGYSVAGCGAAIFRGERWNRSVVGVGVEGREVRGFVIWFVVGKR
uniref:Secreted protein n=1 Tax=Strigamia maritima TaxID=126957 RepID=T1JC75_STRMM